MGLFIRQNESRSQLQSKVAADLSERLNKRPLEAEAPKVSLAILDNQRQTSPLAWVWILLGLVAIIGAVYILTR